MNIHESTIVSQLYPLTNPQLVAWLYKCPFWHDVIINHSGFSQPLPNKSACSLKITMSLPFEPLNIIKHTPKFPSHEIHMLVQYGFPILWLIILPSQLDSLSPYGKLSWLWKITILNW
jgi:hypothetical protein